MEFNAKFIIKRAITLAMIFTVSAFATHFFLKSLVYKGALFSNYKILYYNESNANPVWVYDDKDVRCLSFERPHSEMVRQTCMMREKPYLTVFPSHKMILSSLYLKPYPNKILVLGLGGGAIPFYLNHMTESKADIDVVEINQEVIDIAEKYFFIKNNSKIHIIKSNALEYINSPDIRERYDLIIIDLFDNLYIPHGILSSEFITNAKNALSSDGVIVFNTFYDSNHYEEESILFKNFLGKFYNLHGNGGNRVVIANKGELKELKLIESNALLLDNIFKKVGIINQEALAYFKN